MSEKLGFIQGRLSPMIDGKIQAFPWNHWQNEFSSAKSLGLKIMEWTLDQEGLNENPFMTEVGQREILSLAEQHNVKIASLTGDCFMQAPFFKKGENQPERVKDLLNVISACGTLGVRYLVFPLVDNSSIKSKEEEETLFTTLMDAKEVLDKNNVIVVFESDFGPEKLSQFIEKYPSDSFGINYDIGNSAALGFDPKLEIEAYGKRILNVHIKDRVLGGTTVPLGEGDANFDMVFQELEKAGYSGNLILQTARAPENRHEEYLERFIKFVKDRTGLWN